jgi:transcriptional regulator with XRE-family HTH domain
MELLSMQQGDMLRLLRQKKNLSVRELRRLTGFSASAISQIENGKVIPNVLTMKAISDALGVSVVSFLLDDIRQSISLVKNGERQLLIRNSGPQGDITEEILTKGRNFQMEPGIITVPPLCDSGKAVSHNGEEMVLVLEGEIIYVLEGVQEYHLAEGDTLYYPCTLPHRWVNPSESKKARFLIIVTPSTF